MKGWQVVADNLKKAEFSLGWVSTLDFDGRTTTLDFYGRTTYVADAHRDDGKRFVVHADELLTAFLELELAIRRGA